MSALPPESDIKMRHMQCPLRAKRGHCDERAKPSVKRHRHQRNLSSCSYLLCALVKKRPCRFTPPKRTFGGAQTLSLADPSFSRLWRYLIGYFKNLCRITLACVAAGSSTSNTCIVWQWCRPRYVSLVGKTNERVVALARTEKDIHAGRQHLRLEIGFGGAKRSCYRNCTITVSA
jgi:hypothetical protein